MARRKTKKEKKQQLKQDQFRDTMMDVGNVLKEYKYVLLLAAAVVVLFVVLLSMRSQRQEKQVVGAARLLKPSTNAGPEDLKNEANKVSGEPLEAWLLVRRGRKLYELYQKEDALKGEISRLQEARDVFLDVKKRFGYEPTFVFIAEDALAKIEREMEYEYPEPVRKAYEVRMDAKRKRNAPKSPSAPVPGTAPEKPGRVDTSPEKEKVEKPREDTDPEKDS